jgi:uncharacterized membrane protein YeaQ/YmgE (transglycosylase-associated protein family)
MVFLRTSVSRAVDIGQDTFYKGRSAIGAVSRREKEEETEMGLISWIVVGLIAGWLAGSVMKGGGFGVVVDIVLGILGGVVGGWVFGLLGLHAGGFIGSIIVAFVGAVILVWIARKLKKT